MSSIFDRAIRKLYVPFMVGQYFRYKSKIKPDSPLYAIDTRLIGDARADPTEFFSHYSAFSFWAFQKLSTARGTLKILDLGSPKMMNAMLSVHHDVTSIVLADCGDSISRVSYLQHDVSNRLPFADEVFDIFTSTVTLPLIGLGRYGDLEDPNCLTNFISELNRVMKPNSTLLISMALGPNRLNYNNSWFFDFPTICELFKGWTVIDTLVDRLSGPNPGSPKDGARFSQEIDVSSATAGDYKVVFLHLQRGSPA